MGWNDSGADTAAWETANKWDGGNEAGNDNWNDGGNAADTGAASGWDGKEAGDAGDAGDQRACRLCGDVGHLARACPTAPSSGGGCFNCGQEGHNKAECTNERVARPFTGTCRLCQVEGHAAKDCPTKPPMKCRNCGEEGHMALECKNPHAFNWAGVKDMTPDDAWNDLKKADDERDLDDFRQALKAYCKAVPDSTYHELEAAFRNMGFNTHLIAKKKELFTTQTLVNIQGKIDCTYEVGFYFSDKPQRKSAKEGWPESKEDNMERLKDAGLPMDRGIPKCGRCGELGHTVRGCKDEAEEITRVIVKCANCDEVGHRVRDCPQKRKSKFACRNCGEEGHQSSECTNPRSAEGVECKKCGDMGHFAKDCPKPDTCRNCLEEGHQARDCEKPKNPMNFQCKNCDEVGHFSKECPKPRDYSRVTCNTCGEKGHTSTRCKAEKPETIDAEDGGFNDASVVPASNDAPTGEVGDWNVQEESAAAW